MTEQARSAADRVVSLRGCTGPRPGGHAQVAKILTAGVSTSMVLGIVTYLGHSAKAEADVKARHEAEVAAQQAAVAQAAATLPAVTVPPVQPGTTPPPVTVPAVAAAPQVIALNVPAPVTVARPAATPRRSGGTSGSTSSSH